MTMFFTFGTALVFYIGYTIGGSIHKTLFFRFLTAFSFAFLFCKFHFSFQLVIFSFLVSLLILISTIDYFHGIIPAIFTISLVITGIFFSPFNLILGQTVLSRSANAVLGIVSGGGVLLVMGAAGQFIYKREVLGGGDVRLMAGIGAFIGWQKVLLAVFIASLIVAVAGLILLLLKKNKKKEYISFGPFLSAASFITLFLPQLSHILNAFIVWEMKTIRSAEIMLRL